MVWPIFLVLSGVRLQPAPATAYAPVSVRNHLMQLKLNTPNTRLNRLLNTFVNVLAAHGAGTSDVRSSVELIGVTTDGQLTPFR